MRTDFFISIGKNLFVLLIPILFLSSCSILSSNEDINSECILHEIGLDEFHSLKFQTVSGGRVYSLEQVFKDANKVKIMASYRFRYSENSITVVDQNNPNSLLPFLTVELENERPIQVQRFFPLNGVLLFHDVSYPEIDLIRVDLTREASNGEVLYVGFSNYHLSTEGNVIRNEIFRADNNEPSGFRKLGDRQYTYDSYISPFENLYLPLFADSNFPDVRFFSVNNITSFTENNQTFEFQYQYGESNQTTNQIYPSGESITFDYVNCPG